MSNGYAQLTAGYDIADQEAPKRAIVKPAPTCFTVEVLAPVKQGKAHSFGIRILPVNPQQFQAIRDAGDDAGSDSTSVQSVGREYEIWRRWDDCLDFQEKLEKEYERMSREKKRVLRHGKKGSGDSGGVYKNTNAAASFESLPEGPDPKGIKVDLHAYVPRLSKKASFFSVSDATVQKRADEFAAMIYGLFKMDCPKLIEELRDSSTVRDFFAWWRRDQELLEKAMPQRPTSAMSRTKPGPAQSRASIDSSSIFTTPPSPDSPGFSMLKRHEKEYVHAQRSPTESSASIHSANSIHSPNAPSIITSSPLLRGEKMLPSPPTSPEQLIAASPVKRSRSPMAFRARGTSPQLQISRPMAHPQFGDHGFGLLSPQTDGLAAHSHPSQIRVGRAVERGAQQAGPVPGVGGEGSSDSSSTPPITPTRSAFVSGRDRERPMSVMSFDSIDSADYNIDLSFVKLDPAPPGLGKNRNKRDSVSSVSSLSSLATIRTTDSADGVLPSGLRRQSRASHRARRRRDGPWSPDERLSVAVPEEDESVFYHSDDSQEDADPFALEIDSAFDDTMSYLEKLDSFPNVPGSGPCQMTVDRDADSATQAYYRDRDWRMSFPASVRESMFDPDFDLDAYEQSEPSSPTSTIHGSQLASDSGHSTHSGGTVTSLPLSPGMCSIKAKYAEVIVALRLPVGTPLSTLRARLSEKFLQAAPGLQLHYRFSLAYLPPRRRLSGLAVPNGDEGMPIILSPAALEFSRDGHTGDISVQNRSQRRVSASGAAALTRLVPIWSQDDWDEALRCCGNKIILHVINQEV